MLTVEVISNTKLISSLGRVILRAVASKIFRSKGELSCILNCLGVTIYTKKLQYLPYWCRGLYTLHTVQHNFHVMHVAMPNKCMACGLPLGINFTEANFIHLHIFAANVKIVSKQLILFYFCSLVNVIVYNIREKKFRSSVAELFSSTTS